MTRARSAGPASAAEDPSSAGRDAGRCHVGYYLLDEGRATLERDVAYRRRWRDVVADLAGRTPLHYYLGGIAAVWLLTIVMAAAWPMRLGWTSVSWSGLCLVTLLAGAASQFAVSMVNWLCSRIVPPGRS